MVSKKDDSLLTVVEFAGESGGEIEAKAVDVHVCNPITQRIHDHLQHLGILDIEGVAGAGVIHVVLRIVFEEPVVS